MFSGMRECLRRAAISSDVPEFPARAASQVLERLMQAASGACRLDSAAGERSPMVVRSPRLQARRRRAMMPGSSQLLLAVVVALAFAAPASATQPQPQQFRTIGQLTGANTVAGTWTSTGLIEGDGTYSETFRFAGETFHAQKLLVGRDGTIVLEIRGIVVWLDACTVTVQGWQLAYFRGDRDLRGHQSGRYAEHHRRARQAMSAPARSTLCTRRSTRRLSSAPQPPLRRPPCRRTHVTAAAEPAG